MLNSSGNVSGGGSFLHETASAQTRAWNVRRTRRRASDENVPDCILTVWPHGPVTQHDGTQISSVGGMKKYSSSLTPSNASFPKRGIFHHRNGMHRAMFTLMLCWGRSFFSCSFSSNTLWRVETNAYYDGVTELSVENSTNT